MAQIELQTEKRLTGDHGISDTSLGAGAANAIPKGSPDVCSQVRTILHLIGEVREAVPALLPLEMRGS